MISLKNISKSFHKKSVLCDVSFQISEHSITTLVGPNGIGKTTLLNILCGVLYPDSGIVTCENTDFRKDMFTVLSGSQHLYAKNTVKENIIFLSVLRGRSTAEIAENLEKYRSWFPLYETVQSRLFEELSTGQKQMMLILAALVADARYLLLDEPTEGLDLNHKQMLTDLLRKLKTFKTILITSHDAGFITTLSDHMVFLKEGRIVLDTPGMELSDFLETYHQYYLDEGEEKENIL